MTRASFKWRKQGFTLIELLVSVSIIGILIGIAVPIANVYREKAEYSNVVATLRYLMDGEETYLLENDTFYPEGFGMVSVGRGEEKAIPELNYIFPAGHKHSYSILGFNLEWGGGKINISYIYVYADFDRDGNGRNDLYIAMTYLKDGEPMEVGGVPYYRTIQQFW